MRNALRLAHPDYRDHADAFIIGLPWREALGVVYVCGILSHLGSIY